MNKAELDKILDNHKLWLSSGGDKGERADLFDADLRCANLCGANLRCANLCGADLRCANLFDADLRGANLCGADLCGAKLRDADLRCADLCGAKLRDPDLRCANLCGANLRDADLDFSAFPLWCGGLDVHIDDKQAVQLLYHLVRNVKNSKNTSAEMKKLCKLKSIVKKANEFHRVEECGVIE